MGEGGGVGKGTHNRVQYLILGISCPLLSGWLDPTLTKTYFAINL